MKISFNPFTKGEIDSLLVETEMYNEFVSIYNRASSEEKFDAVQDASYEINLELDEKETIESIANGDGLIQVMFRAQIGFLDIRD